MKTHVRKNPPATSSPASEHAKGESPARLPVSDSPRQMQQAQRIAQFKAPADLSGALPEGLARGIAHLSGVDVSDVRVHTGSSQPAQLNAEAFAKGRDIHLAPGGEKHLPHEAWHVVQQRQGRVRPTGQVAGQALNDDPRLEREADAMGQRALSAGSMGQAAEPHAGNTAPGVVQQARGQGRGQTGGNRDRPSQIPHRTKPADEQRHREAIGRNHARRAPQPPRRRQPEPPPGREREQAPGHRGDGLPARRGNQEGDVIIDMPEDEQLAPEASHGWRGVGRRIRAKAFAGRTFGDTSNSLGAAANLVPSSETATASTLLIIGSAGVLTSGLKLLYDGTRQYHSAGNRRDRALATATIASGLMNLLSGVYGLESGFFKLAGNAEADSATGIASTATWAASELINVVVQTETLIRNCVEGKSWRHYVKPGMATLASLIKLIGAVLYVGGDSDHLGAWAMSLGAAISVLQGVIKLLKVLHSEWRQSAGEDDEEPHAGDENDVRIDINLDPDPH